MKQTLLYPLRCSWCKSLSLKNGSSMLMGIMLLAWFILIRHVQFLRTLRPRWEMGFFFFLFFHTASDEVLRAHNLTSHSPLALQMKNSPLCQLLRCLFLHLLFVLGLTLLITVPPKPYCSALQEECCYIDCLCVSPALSGAALGWN